MVTLDDVRKIAELSHLRFDDAELSKYTEQLNRILQYVDKLNELNTDDVDITYHPIDYPNVFREDELRTCLGVDEALMNAPEKNWQYFVVPKVVS